MASKNLIYLILLPLLLILLKWILNFYYYEDLIYELNFLLNFNDQQYFPFIISLSNLEFSPSHNEFFKPDGTTSFPYASIMFHALLFKILDLPSIIIGEIIFYILAYYIVYIFLIKSGINETSSIFVTILIFFSPIVLEHSSSIIQNINIYNIKDLIFNYHLISLRFPRPLVTDIFFYTSILILLNFIKNNFEKKYSYYA